MRKIPISGGPHTGKTTLLEALKVEFPGAHFVPEAAENVIARELAKQKEDSEYTPVVPWTDYSLFGPVVAQESVSLEAEIPSGSNIVFQDRSLIDTIAYYRLNNLEAPISEVQRLVAVANYAFAFFCEPVGTYETTDIRREGLQEAKRTHDFLTEAYDQSGLEVIYIPAVSVEERIDIIRATLQ